MFGLLKWSLKVFKHFSTLLDNKKIFTCFLQNTQKKNLHNLSSGTIYSECHFSRSISSEDVHNDLFPCIFFYISLRIFYWKTIVVVLYSINTLCCLSIKLTSYFCLLNYIIHFYTAETCSWDLMIDKENFVFECEYVILHKHQKK